MKTLHALLTASALALAASSNPVRGAAKDAVEAEDRVRRQADIIYVTPDGQRYAIPPNVFGANQGATFRSVDGDSVDSSAPAGNEPIANVASVPVRLQPPVALVPPQSIAVPAPNPAAIPAPVPAPDTGYSVTKGPRITRKKATTTAPAAAAPSVNVPAGVVSNQPGVVAVVPNPQVVPPPAPTTVRLRPKPSAAAVQPNLAWAAPQQVAEKGVVQLAPPGILIPAPVPVPAPVQVPMVGLVPPAPQVAAPAPPTVVTDSTSAQSQSEEPAQSGPTEVPMDVGTSVFGCWRSRLPEMKASRCKCETACGQQYPTTLPSLCPLARDGDPFRQACVLMPNCTQERNDAFPCKPAADGTYGDVTCELMADVVQSAVRCRLGDGTHWAEGSSRCTPDKPQEIKVCSNGEWKVLTYPSPAATCHRINDVTGRGDMGCPYFQATTFTIKDAYKNKYVVIDGRTMASRWDG